MLLRLAGLPVAVRDAIIQKYGGQKAFVPKSELGFHQHQEKLENSGASSAGNDQLTDAAHAELMKMKAQRDAQGPDYRRNMPKYCTFTAKGEDTRGAENPYSTQPPPPEHMQGDGKGIQQSIRDRFFGVDDKQASSMLNKHEGKVQQQIEPPADQDIKTLWLGGIEESIEEQHLRSTFSEYGEIVRVHIVRNSKCAFVEFASRAQAEQAAAASQGSLTINGYNCRVSWAKKKSPDSENQSDNAANPTLVQQPPQPGSSPEAYANYQQYVWQAWNQYYAQQQAMAAAQQQGASSTASASNNSSSQGSTHATQLPPMPPMPPPPGSADASKSSGKGGPAKKSGNKEERKQATTPYYPSMDPTRVGSRVVEGS